MDKIALGSTKSGNAKVVDDISLEEKVDLLWKRIEQLEQMLNDFDVRGEKDRRKNTGFHQQLELFSPNIPLNNDGIPIGTTLVGRTETGTQRMLYVGENAYSIGDYSFGSLSAAAEWASNVKRNGWKFWKTSENKSADEAFRTES